MRRGFTDAQEKFPDSRFYSINTAFCTTLPLLTQKKVAMSAVYKKLSKTKGEKASKEISVVEGENRQRVLILSSRGVTYRYEYLSRHGMTFANSDLTADTGIF